VAPVSISNFDLRAARAGGGFWAVNRVNPGPLQDDIWTRLRFPPAVTPVSSMAIGSCKLLPNLTCGWFRSANDAAASRSPPCAHAKLNQIGPLPCPG
jgi:hypothetical protein